MADGPGPGDPRREEAARADRDARREAERDGRLEAEHGDRPDAAPRPDDRAGPRIDSPPPDDEDERRDRFERLARHGTGDPSDGTPWRRHRRRAWLSVRRLVRRYGRARVGTLAAALAYYAAFSLGPLLLLLGGWLGQVLQARPDIATRYRNALSDLLAPVLPEGLDSLTLIERSFEAVVDQLAQGTILRGILSLLVLLWASSGFFASLQRALEEIFEVPETRGFVRTRIVALLLIAMVAVVIGVEIIGGSLAAWTWGVVTDLLNRLGALGVDLPDPPRFLEDPGPLRILLAILAFALCFRFLPRQGSRWDGALLGALVSVAGLQAMRVLLPLVFDQSRFNLVYGVVASLVVLLLWLYLALMLFLMGALVAAEASAAAHRRAQRRSHRAPDGTGSMWP